MRCAADMALIRCWCEQVPNVTVLGSLLHCIRSGYLGRFACPGPLSIHPITSKVNEKGADGNDATLPICF